MDDEASLARLFGALRPWLNQLVVVGGWAHRLHRLHPLAGVPTHPPLRTRDVDLAVAAREVLPGDIGGALERAGFRPTLLGDDSPPVTHYALEGDAGFYAEFLTPLEGGEFTRRDRRDVTVARAGITAQKLRHLDILMVAPWYVGLDPHSEIVLVPPANVLLPNPVAFMMQKLLIQRDRRPEKRAQDLLYIHDTLELFGGALEELRTVWRGTLRPAMSERTARRAETCARTLFEHVTDDLRAAARISDGRRLTADTLRGASDYGLKAILGE